jgi:hypothetical protein
LGPFFYLAHGYIGIGAAVGELCMACMNIRKASFRIFAYGDNYDLATNKVNNDDEPQDTGQEFTASVERMGEIIANDKTVADALYYFKYDATQPLQLWHIPSILLVDIFHFSHRYLTSYVATAETGYREFVIKYGSAPTWFLKRIL